MSTKGCGHEIAAYIAQVQYGIYGTEGAQKKFQSIAIACGFMTSTVIWEYITAQHNNLKKHLNTLKSLP